MKKKSVMKRLAMTMAVFMTAAAAAGCGSGSGGGSTTAAPAAPAATEAAGSEAAGGEAKEADTQAAADDWKWERKVTIVCPWGVGGGADGTLRPLQPILEKELGVPVEIVNVEGAGGANGIDFTYKQPADGYTFVLGTQSHIMLDLQKILPVDFKQEFRPVSKLVHSINIIQFRRVRGIREGTSPGADLWNADRNRSRLRILKADISRRPWLWYHGSGAVCEDRQLLQRLRA